SAACAISGSAWLSPAATTTLQCVEGKKSLRPRPSSPREFTLTACIKIAEDRQATRKSKFRAARAPESVCTRESHHHAQPLKPTRKYNMKKPIKEARIMKNTQLSTQRGIMNMKKVIIGMACCAAIAPLAFGQGPHMARLGEQGVTVTAPNAAVKIEGGEAAGYHPPKTLVVHSEGSGRYVLAGRGHVFNSKGEVV